MRDTSDKVKFLVIGTQKGGTSALDRYLRQHSEIQMAKQKEVHFFDNEQYFTPRLFSNKVNYKKYHGFFDNSKGKLRGECTPIYMYWRESIKRIYQYNPDMKLIAVLRNPSERAFSHWNMERDRGAETLPFHDAIINELGRCRDELPFMHRVYSYVDRGFYAEQIRNVWRFFPKRQTLFIKHSALKNDLTSTLDEVSAFLGVSDFEKQEQLDVHSREYVSAMTEQDRTYLKDLYFHDIKQVEKMLGWDCTEWLESE